MPRDWWRILDSWNLAQLNERDKMRTRLLLGLLESLGEPKKEAPVEKFKRQKTTTADVVFLVVVIIFAALVIWKC
jgi:hypothetical protein